MEHGEADRQWLESLKIRGMNLGLKRTKLYCDQLGIAWPQHVFHIAGSNGKGTTCAHLVGLLEHQGYNTLFFSSPHLVRVEERTRYKGKPISSDLYSLALRKLREKLPHLQNDITFFEATFLITLACLSLLDVDVLVLETGLGGRLDATRVAPATCSILTSISCEHTDILGDTVEAIAREKAAIARPNHPIYVRTPEQISVRVAIEDITQNPFLGGIDSEAGPSPLHWIDIAEHCSYVDEANEIAQVVLKSYLNIDCRDVKIHPFWPGRQHILISNSIEFYLEGAHNPSGMLRSLQSISHDWPTKWSLLFGTSPQQSMDEMLQPLLELMKFNPPSEIVLTCPQKGRYPGVDTHLLRPFFSTYGLNVKEYERPNEAVKALLSTSPKGHRILVIGSLYLQGNVIEALGFDTDEDLSILND